MSNLNLLRTEISNAERNGDATVVLSIEQARQLIRDAEKMAGGSNDLTIYRDEIADLKSKIERMKAEKPVDKVAALLLGDES